MNLKVAIVDDHPLFSDGLKYYLLSNNKIGNIEMFPNGEVFLDAMTNGLSVDLVFMDIIMPVKDGMETTKELKANYPAIKVLGISSMESIEHIEAMIESGADGYLLKNSSVHELDSAINEATKDNYYFSPNVMAILTKRNIRRTFDTKKIVDKISEREMEVLRLICSGYNKYQIADMLYISHRTVDKHRENILDKTGSENVIQLMTFSLNNNLVTINS